MNFDYTPYDERLHRAHLTSEKLNIFVNHLVLPSPDNGNVCVMQARVETDKGTFTDYGDASPENVGRNIAPHIIRMASTRAKARALGMAINVGEPAEEEFTEAPSRTPAPVQSEANGAEEDDRGLSSDTETAIVLKVKKIAELQGQQAVDAIEALETTWVHSRTGVSDLSSLTEEQGQELLQALEDKLKAAKDARKK